MNHETLLELLKATNIKHDGTIPSIIQATQKHWHANSYEHLKPQLMPLFKKLGMIDEKEPTQQNYDYVLVFNDIQNSYTQALMLWQKGTRYKRLLVVSKDPDSKRIFDDTDLPAEFNAEVAFISSQQNDLTKVIESWLATQPQSGTLLVISKQPLVDYHQALLATLLPNTIISEVTGTKAHDNITVGEIFESLAKRLYLEKA